LNFAVDPALPIISISAPRERHNDAGQGGALAFARLDQSRFHPITDAADHVDPAAHPLKRYDVRRVRSS